MHGRQALDTYCARANHLQERNKIQYSYEAAAWPRRNEDLLRKHRRSRTRFGTSQRKWSTAAGQQQKIIAKLMSRSDIVERELKVH
jgi:hypothetical protein